MTTHNDVKEAALHNKTLHSSIMRYEIGQCTWEEAMMAAAVSLATQYNNLMADSINAIQERGGKQKIQRIKLKIMRKEGCEDLPLPGYQSPAASGMDLHAAIELDIPIPRGDIKLILTGVHIALPTGYEAQVRPRSGLALKHGITIVNSPGTIDSDYRGEIGVILCNLGKDTFVVKRGMRIAQLVVQPVVHAELEEVIELEDTHRGEGGFGHTGH